MSRIGASLVVLEALVLTAVAVGLDSHGNPIEYVTLDASFSISSS